MIGARSKSHEQGLVSCNEASVLQYPPKDPKAVSTQLALVLVHIYRGWLYAKEIWKEMTGLRYLDPLLHLFYQYAAFMIEAQCVAFHKPLKWSPHPHKTY